MWKKINTFIAAKHIKQTLFSQDLAKCIFGSNFFLGINPIIRKIGYQVSLAGYGPTKVTVGSIEKQDTNFDQVFACTSDSVLNLKKCKFCREMLSFPIGFE